MKMRTITVLATIGVIVVALWATQGRSKSRRVTEEAGGTVAPAGYIPIPTAAPAPAMDSGAVHALERMGAYLRTLKNFQIEADVTTEEVLEDGQKVQLTSHVQLVAVRPNRLRAEVVSDRKERLFIYDGKTFALFAPRQKFYSTIDAPSSINDLATLLESKYDVDLPLVDLFRWGTSPDQIKALKAAKDIGPAMIDDVTCNQYAFRQDGMDWQVWIQNGQNPLPRKIVLTTLTDDARPQHVAQYTWNLAPSFNEGAFVVEAPDGFRKIAMAEARAPSTTQQKGDTKQ